MTETGPESFELAGVGTFVSDPSMWQGYYLGPEFTVDVLGGIPIAFAIGDGPLDGRSAELAREAIHNFQAAGSALRDETGGYIFEYYQSIRKQFSDEDCREYGIPLDVTVDNIWDHVTFRSPPTVEPSLNDFKGLLHADIAYVNFECGCSWEPEHGLQLVFVHGERIGKVSGYDGHPTNAHASADPALLDIIFRG